MGRFYEMLAANWGEGRHLCVGLDLDERRIVDRTASADVTKFGHEVVDATSEIAAAYKPNSAFFEARGQEGIADLKQIISYIHRVAPAAPVILDAKRADIASTNDGYTEFAYEYLEADAITLHPYLGGEAIRPFLERQDKGNFILCRTSNPGAGEFQDLDVNGAPLYLRVADAVVDRWNINNNCGLVVGATYTDELADVRAHAGDIPLLIPGIGAQGGEVEATVRAAASKGRLRAIVNASRSILFPKLDRPIQQADIWNEAYEIDTKLRDALRGLRS